MTRASAAYAAIAVVMTWPLARHATTAIGPDLGDPLFNIWVLLWTSGQVLAAASGDLGALGDYWQGNIFHPQPYALALSEHLTPQMLMALPVLALTGNGILAYNLLFLASFVLSAGALFWLVRTLTGHSLAAFIAGLAFAWAPYRLEQLSHLQVLTTFWMPLALLGFHRFVATGRTAPLAGGTVALVAQNLSCGYFLLYFPPFVAAWCLHEMVRLRRTADRRVWAGLTAAALTAAALTWPFVSPYLELREEGGAGVRPVEEIRRYSADVTGLGATPPASDLWRGVLPASRTPEGAGFPGLTILLLVSVAMGSAVARTASRSLARDLPVTIRLAGLTAILLMLAHVAAAGALLASGELWIPLGGTWFVHTNPAPLLLVVALSALALAAIAALLPARGAAPWPVGFAAAAVALSILLALGPAITSSGRVLGPGPYAWLLQLPGFDGARVPARFLMVAALWWALLAGFGAAMLLRRLPSRVALLVAGVLAAGVLAESWMAPMTLNARHGAAEGLVPPGTPPAGREIDPIYRVIADLPGTIILIEFPFGDEAYELRAIYHAGHHRRPVINGYSGYVPEHYAAMAGTLQDVPADPERAQAWLAESGATHALVHEAAFEGARGAAVSAWLLDAGARPVADSGSSRLFQLK